MTRSSRNMVEESRDVKLKLEDCNVAMEMQNEVVRRKKKPYRILITERNEIVAERMQV